MKSKNRKIGDNTRFIVLSAVCTAFLCVCSWITIPFFIPFTLQTMAVFMTSYLLPMKYSLLSYVCYLLLGAVGVPVFSGFKGGVQVFLGPTGGYLLGFFFIFIFIGTAKIIFKDKQLLIIVFALLGLLLCYFTAVLFYIFLYAQHQDFKGVFDVLSLLVLPFILPDIIKLVLSVLVSKKIQKAIF